MHSDRIGSVNRVLDLQQRSWTQSSSGYLFCVRQDKKEPMIDLNNTNARQQCYIC